MIAIRFKRVCVRVWQVYIMDTRSVEAGLVHLSCKHCLVTKIQVFPFKNFVCLCRTWGYRLILTIKTGRGGVSIINIVGNIFLYHFFYETFGGDRPFKPNSSSGNG